MAMPFRGLAPFSMADAVSKFLIESLHDAHSDYFLVPFGQKSTNLFQIEQIYLKDYLLRCVS